VSGGVVRDVLYAEVAVAQGRIANVLLALWIVTRRVP
jgi:hypothetical protein